MRKDIFGYLFSLFSSIIDKVSISMFFNYLIISWGCVKLSSLDWLLMCWLLARLAGLAWLDGLAELDGLTGLDIFSVLTTY